MKAMKLVLSMQRLVDKQERYSNKTFLNAIFFFKLPVGKISFLSEFCLFLNLWDPYSGVATGGGEAACPGCHSLGSDTQSMDQYLRNDTNRT